MSALETEAPIKGEPKTKRFKLATSSDNHWVGLTRFVKNPFIPMDNNPAEQALRMPVAGRRSFYDSGSIWSADSIHLIQTPIKLTITPLLVQNRPLIYHLLSDLDYNRP